MRGVLLFNHSRRRTHTLSLIGHLCGRVCHRCYSSYSMQERYTIVHTRFGSTHDYDGDFLVKLLVTVDGREEKANRACEDLDHETVLASCNEMVDFEMPFCTSVGRSSSSGIIPACGLRWRSTARSSSSLRDARFDSPFEPGAIPHSTGHGGVFSRPSLTSADILPPISRERMRVEPLPTFDSPCPSRRGEPHGSR
jgi:hypothetical protein